VKFLPELFRLAATHDVLFVQKRTFPAWVLKPLLRINPHIVYDVDDAVFLRPEQYGPVDLMLQHAHTVIAGNDYLADYAARQNPRVVILPTVIDTDLYTPPEGPRHAGDDRVHIGWIGSDPNFGSLELLQPVFDWLAGRYGDRVVFKVVGRAPLRMDTPLRQEFLPWDMQRSRQDLKSFDLGLMPLEDSAWNRGKCGFKLIQYMAVGIPSIASAVGANRQIVQQGTTGFLVEKPAEWQAALKTLIEDEATRRQMGRQARQAVEQRYSMDAVLPQLVEVLYSAASRS
jgi:glycosyltransferase involved in cell wall biosynthesis